MTKGQLTLFSVLLGWSLAAFSKPVVSNNVYRVVIEKAQARALEKDRVGAAQILVDQARLEKKEGPGHKELLRALDSLTEVFFSEKTQQTFELGRSEAATDTASAIGHFREALKEEPYNLSIIKALGRALLMQGDCEQVHAVADDGLKIHPFSRDAGLLKIQALACLHRGEEVRSYLKTAEANLSQMLLQVELALAQILFFEEKLDLAMGSAQKAKSMDPGFPESYYWLAQISERAGKEDLAYARVYVQLCKEMNLRLRKKYEVEPRTCLESKKVQTKLETRPAAPPAKGTPKTPPA